MRNKYLVEYLKYGAKQKIDVFANNKSEALKFVSESIVNSYERNSIKVVKKYQENRTIKFVREFSFKE